MKKLYVLIFGTACWFQTQAQCPTLTPSLSSVSCHDNGTVANAGDDYITFLLEGDALKSDLAHTYTVTAMQGGSPVAVTLSDGSSSSGLYFGYPSPVKTPLGTAGHGNITLTITTSAGCTATVTLNDPGTCSSAAASCSPGSITYSYRSPFKYTNISNEPLDIPKFDTNGGTRTLTQASLSTSFTIGTLFVYENTSSATTDASAYLNIDGTADISLNGTQIQNYASSLINTGDMPMGTSQLVPAGANGSTWPGDTPYGLGGVSTIRTSESLGLSDYLNNIFVDPTQSSTWVTNITGLPGSDDDMGFYQYTGTESASSSHTAPAELTQFTGSGNLGLIFNSNANFQFGSNGGNVLLRLRTKGYATATVTYNYTCAVLPVKLTSFEGKVQDDRVNLTWKTAEETDFSHFEVKKSPNAKDFEAIGKVSGGSSDGQYSFIDADVAEGDNYYRLEMVDLDGSSGLSKMISVYYEKDGSYLVVENPSTGGVVNLTTNMDEPVFELRTVLGVRAGIQTLKTDTNQYELHVPNMTMGQYYLTVRDKNNKVVVKRLLMQ